MELIAVGKSGQLNFSGAHTHDTWEIILNLEGSGTMIVGSEEFPFATGDVVCIPPQVPHIKKADTVFVDTFVNISGTVISSDKYFCFHDIDGSVAGIMSMILSYYHRGERNYLKIADKLAAALEEVVIGKAEIVQNSSRTERIVAMIIEHLNEPDFSVTEAMSSLGYCDDHARRIFCREMGKTPLLYMTDLRIAHAKKLLTENHRLHHTVAEVALASGYSDISYFSRVFKKRTGMSPRAYLAKYGKKNISDSL